MILWQAFVIAFSTDLVPKLVYMVSFSENSSLHGYNKWRLSEFAIDDYANSSMPATAVIGRHISHLPETCWSEYFVF